LVEWWELAGIGGAARAAAAEVDGRLAAAVAGVG